MKRAIMCFLGAMMVLSLAACTPTTEKSKTGQVRETESVSYEKNPDPTAPELEVVSIYTVSEDGSKLEGTMDAVSELTPQSLVDLLIEYEVLEEGTEVFDYTEEGEAASAAAGPGAAEESSGKEYATLNLSQVPGDGEEMVLKAIARTFMENMNVEYVTIEIDGDLLIENISVADVE